MEGDKVYGVNLPSGKTEFFTSKRIITHCVVGITPLGSGVIFCKCGSEELAKKALAKELRLYPLPTGRRIVAAIRVK